MKKIIVIFLCMLVMCSVYTYAQVRNKNGQLDSAEIRTIRKNYDEINSHISSYNTKTISIYDESTEGAELVGYYKNKELKKIVGWFYGETERSLYEYYYIDDNFFFVYSKHFKYEPPIEEPYIWDRNKIVSMEEDRWYFNNGKLIRWISGKENIPETSNDFLEYYKSFIKQFEKYKDIFINGKSEKYGVVWNNTTDNDDK